MFFKTIELNYKKKDNNNNNNNKSRNKFKLEVMLYQAVPLDVRFYILI